MLEDHPEYIIKQRTNQVMKQDGERQYYVKWTGYDETGNTWESEQKLLAEWPFVLKEYRRCNVQTEPIHVSNMDAETVFEYTNSVVDWEASVDCIVYVEKSKLSGLVVYVKW
ncbi:hypothetical protein MFLAVUS_004787 [Mucor flavus]|uniref:Chromo domain-containing protein n=1 Tax=Mucor flavus TaxID=439312 RepID=A0ABP9YX03_9FUNG